MLFSEGGQLNIIPLAAYSSTDNTIARRLILVRGKGNCGPGTCDRLCSNVCRRKRGIDGHLMGFTLECQRCQSNCNHGYPPCPQN